MLQGLNINQKISQQISSFGLNPEEWIVRIKSEIEDTRIYLENRKIPSFKLMGRISLENELLVSNLDLTSI